MKPFTVAWMILKADSRAPSFDELARQSFPEGIAAPERAGADFASGFFKDVMIPKDFERPVIKLPAPIHEAMFSSPPHEVATMNALSELGLPFSPEKPMSAVDISGLYRDGYLTPSAVFPTSQEQFTTHSDLRHQAENELDAAYTKWEDENAGRFNDFDEIDEREIDSDIQTARDKISGLDVKIRDLRDLEHNNPLTRFLDISDVKPANVGYRKDSDEPIHFDPFFSDMPEAPKTINQFAQTNPPWEDKVPYARSGPKKWGVTRFLENMQEIPSEQLTSFRRFYDDPTQFENWSNPDLDLRDEDFPGLPNMWEDEKDYNKEIQDWRNFRDAMAWGDTFINDPAQRRLYEFENDGEYSEYMDGLRDAL